MTKKNPILMYGTTWCPDCLRAKQVLDRHQVAYSFINIEEDESAVEIVTKLNDGMKSVPTLVFPDTSVLVEPSNQVLEDKLKQLQLIA